MSHVIRVMRIAILAAVLSRAVVADEAWITLTERPGVAEGRRVVLISGDEEYRSEEAMPMLGRLLAAKFGFRCTVLFAIDRASGEINPNTVDHIPGLEMLDSADLMVVFTRFRVLPDDAMRHVDRYVRSGRPIIGIRPSVVAFRNRLDGPFARYSSDYRGEDFLHGFGRQVLGATWISHHGEHGRESTRGIPVESRRTHPILRGVGIMWGPTDVYTVDVPIAHDGDVLVMGHVLEGMTADAPLSAKRPMPLAWTKKYPTSHGDARVFMTTMGDARDFLDGSFRRMVVNACLWAVNLEDRIAGDADVAPVGPYDPSPFGFHRFQKGRFPRDYAR